MAGQEEKPPTGAGAAADLWAKAREISSQLSDDEKFLIGNIAQGVPADGQSKKTVRAQVVRALILTKEATLGAGYPFEMSNFKVEGDLKLEGQTIDRSIAIKRCDISGDVIIRYSKLRVLFLDGSHIRHLEGIRTHITTSLYVRKNIDNKDIEPVRHFEARGKVDLSGCRIEGALSARGAKIAADPELQADMRTNRKYALDLTDADIGSILLGPKDDVGERKDLDWTFVNGSISFQRARCTSFTDCKVVYNTTAIRGGHDRLSLRGFRYDYLGPEAPRGVKFRKKWLRADERVGSEQPIDPQPYEQLASVLKNQGETRAAYGINITKARRVLRGEISQLSFEAPLRALLALSLPLRWVLSELIGFGYRPHRILFAFAALLALSGGYFNNAFEAGRIGPSNVLVARTDAWTACRSTLTQEERAWSFSWDSVGLDECALPDVSQGGVVMSEPTPEQRRATEEARALSVYPNFNGYWYAMDVLLPIVSLRQQEFWIATDRTGEPASVRWMTQLLTLIGWLMSTLGIGGALSYINRR